MHMLFMPFGEDIREPECDSTYVGVDAPYAEPNQVEAAAQMLEGMTLLEYNVDDYPNPRLQRHYEVGDCVCCWSLNHFAVRFGGQQKELLVTSRVPMSRLGELNCRGPPCSFTEGGQHFQTGVLVCPGLVKPRREMRVDACCKAATHL